MADTLIQAVFRESLIQRLIKLNVDCVDMPLIRIAGRLGTMCLVTAKMAGLSKEKVMMLMSEGYDKIDDILKEFGVNANG